MGLTPLHNVCCNDSVTKELVEAVLKKCPEAGTMKDNDNGDTPLHKLCGNASVTKELVKTLLEKSPAAGMQDKKGRTPLHVVCRNPEVKKEVLEVFLNCEQYMYDSKVTVKQILLSSFSAKGEVSSRASQYLLEALVEFKFATDMCVRDLMPKTMQLDKQTFNDSDPEDIVSMGAFGENSSSSRTLAEVHWCKVHRIVCYKAVKALSESSSMAVLSSDLAAAIISEAWKPSLTSASCPC